MVDCRAEQGSNWNPAARHVEPLSTTISILALSLSGITAWLTLFRRGAVKMTQPTVIFFGPDSGRPNESPLPKIYLRALLFATSKRGCVIESMYVAPARNETRQNFNIWVYGNEKLVRWDERTARDRVEEEARKSY